MSIETEIPDSWHECRLGEVVAYGTTQKAEPDEISDDAWVLELEDIEKDTSKVLQQLTFKQRQSKSTKSRFSSGDVLYGKLRPYLNKVVRANRSGFCTTEIVPLKPNDIVNGGYLFYWLKNPIFLDYVGQVSHGLNMPRLGTEAGRQAPFVLAPVNEQKRIADKLDAVLARVDACRERLDRIPSILKRFRQSVLAAATSGKLTEEWRIDKGVDEEWQSLSVGDICESSYYGPRFGKNEYTDDPAGIPTIRTTDMTVDGKIEVTSDTPRVAVPESKLDGFKVRQGDLLVTRTGSIGVMAVFLGDYPAIPSAYLIRFRFKDRILARYAYFCLAAPNGQEQMGLSTTAITQPNINAESIKKIALMLPSIDEQREIIRRVDQLFERADQIHTCYTTARAQVERLTPALLAKAFRGELVPQDPNDEPASELLLRLQAKGDSVSIPTRGARQRWGEPSRSVTPGLK